MTSFNGDDLLSINEIRELENQMVDTKKRRYSERAWKIARYITAALVTAIVMAVLILLMSLLVVMTIRVWRMV